MEFSSLLNIIQIKKVVGPVSKKMKILYLGVKLVYRLNQTILSEIVYTYHM